MLTLQFVERILELPQDSYLKSLKTPFFRSHDRITPGVELELVQGRVLYQGNYFDYLMMIDK